MKKFMALLSVLFVFNAYALESPHALEITHEMGTASFKTTPQKVVALDWVLSETVLSLGVELEGIADAKGYQQWVVKPELNQGVTDVGSRREPNLELLTKLKPDVILISEHMAAAYHQLNKIAPVLVYSVYSQKKQPIESATAITLSLGKLFDQEQRAQQIITDTKQRLHDNGEKIQAAGNSDKPLIFARFINDKTLRVHSQGSLAQATIQAMGLKNDWQEPTNLWGFSTTGVVRLAEHQQTNVMLFGPLTENEKNQLTQSALWQAMEFTRTDSVYELPSIWTFGGLIAAQRFSDHITELLTQK
ncbi:peptide ABC transporter substrate-binding protein [Vibrio chagasii]|uniref:Peptide ABC transporter substrate-binding protein n=1 Tax=Vibrio chagasii TaxID=170679 RepID=A0A2S7VCQ7_9VIBR|nr:iron-siderophore ABC transporter substrate-binding protein [Vibrio chagasii]PQJ59973.1 peptide ABC transporter substrate-binding protein [Vibrio chagasii]|tara:strand:- start:950 stop:1861 length:912 start_codon:yes stop_codon:yes gene_type:complete